MQKKGMKMETVLKKKMLGALTMIVFSTLVLTSCGSGASSADSGASGNRIGIIGAMEEEVATIKEHMTDKKETTVAGMVFCEGKLDGKDVVVVKCGIGKVNAGVCTQTLIDRFSADSVINTGVAGSLDADIDIGDIVVSTDAVQHDFDLTPIGYAPGELDSPKTVAISADEKMREKAVAAVKEIASDVSVFEGRVCSGDQFLASREQKERIVSTFGGMCCEMEGAAIAQVCSLNDTPFVIIRAISDKADDSEELSYEQFEKAAAEHCASVTEYMVTH